MPDYATVTLRPIGTPALPRPGFYYDLPALGPALCTHAGTDGTCFVGADMRRYNLRPRRMQAYILEPTGGEPVQKPDAIPYLAAIGISLLLAALAYIIVEQLGRIWTFDPRARILAALIGFAGNLIVMLIFVSKPRLIDVED